MCVREVCSAQVVSPTSINCFESGRTLRCSPQCLDRCLVLVERDDESVDFALVLHDAERVVGDVTDYNAESAQDQVERMKRAPRTEFDVRSATRKLSAGSTRKNRKATHSTRQ